MKKNEEKVGVVVSLGANGEGVLKQDGTVVFVPFVLSGEKIRYKVLKVTSKCAYGKVLEVLTPAEERVRALCPVFTKCGGCHLQHIKYFNQLKIKEEIITNPLLPIRRHPVIRYAKHNSTIRSGWRSYVYRKRSPIEIIGVVSKH